MLDTQSFLRKFFDAFYKELLQQKYRASTSHQRPDASQAERGDAAHGLVESIATQLISLLDAQQAQVMQHGGDYALTLYRDVQYIMVALADEFFLEINWSGRALWESNILEQRVFNTHVAGELIYERVDTLLGKQDPELNEISKIYLLALSLGFKGKFQGDPVQISAYKKRIFLFIHHHHPQLKEEGYTLFPKAYSALLEDGTVRQLSSPRLWYGILWSSVFFILLLSYGVWYSTTKKVYDVSQEIIKVSGVDEP